MFLLTNFFAFFASEMNNFVYLCRQKMEVVLIRHTRVAVAQGICYGQADVDVAETFAEEAVATMAKLSAYGVFDAVYSSPLKRARLLSAYCGYARPVVDDRLMEMSMGEWELRPYDELDDPYSKAWFENYMTMPTPGGESFQMLYDRVAAFLDELRLKDYDRVAVFAHGGVLACAGLYAGLYDQDHIWENHVEYGGVMCVTL